MMLSTSRPQRPRSAFSYAVCTASFLAYPFRKGAPRLGHRLLLLLRGPPQGTLPDHKSAELPVGIEDIKLERTTRLREFGQVERRSNLVHLGPSHSFLLRRLLGGRPAS